MPKMEKLFSNRDFYQRLYMAAHDLGHAKEYFKFLIKNEWHHAPYERRGNIYLQQSAFTTSAVISYSRPFTKSYGWPSFPSSLLPYGEKEIGLHQHFLNLRNEVYAHSDSKHNSIRPFITDEFSTDIVGTPFLRLTAEECTLAVHMIISVQEVLLPEVVRLRHEIEDKA